VLPAAAVAAILPATMSLLQIGPVEETAAIGTSLLALAAGGGLLALRLGRSSHTRLVSSIDASTRDALRDGRLEPVDVNDTAVQGVASAVNECLAAAADVAESAHLESQRTRVELKLLDRQRADLRDVVAAMEDAVLVVDGFGDVVLINRTAGKLFGEPDTPAAGTALVDLIPDERLIGLVQEVARADSASRRTEELDLTPAQTDRPRSYRVTLNTLRHDAGGRPSVVVVLHDATRERELQQQKNDFVSSVTHELRTPLSSIRAYVEMLVDDDAESEAERREFCEIIQGEAERLGSMIDSILSISRIESGLVKIDRRPHSPMAIAEKALGVIEPQAKLKEIEIRRELLPAMFQVIADGELLYQVVLNLLSNAVKYTPAGGTVTLRTEVDEAKRTIVTKVVDDGAGIPESDLPHVFDKFYRVERNSKMAKGTGLGLPLVKRVVEEDFGGRVWAQSTVDVGSTFAFELPMVELQQQGTPSPAPAPRRAA
jgi:two-component system phosphate regulon sensor histidine kinase PhoR